MGRASPVSIECSIPGLVEAVSFPTKQSEKRSMTSNNLVRCSSVSPLGIIHSRDGRDENYLLTIHSSPTIVDTSVGRRRIL